MYCSTGIESVVGKPEKEQSSANSDIFCTACEMAVVWMQNQLRMNETKELILKYANQVANYLNLILYLSLPLMNSLYTEWASNFFVSYVKNYQAPWENQLLIVIR